MNFLKKKIQVLIASNARFLGFNIEYFWMLANLGRELEKSCYCVN